MCFLSKLLSYPQSYTTTTSHEINQKEQKLRHNRIDDGYEKFELQIQKENFSMNNCINILRDKVREIKAKYEPVNWRNVHVTKEKGFNAPKQGLNIIKLEKTL